MGSGPSVPTAVDPWSVYESPYSRVPQFRTTEYPNMLAETPWMFRKPNRPLFLLIGWVAVVVAVIWILT